MDLEAIKVLLDAQDRTFKTAMDIVIEQFNSRIKQAEGTIADLTRSLEFTQATVEDLQSEVRVLKKSDIDNKTKTDTLDKQIVELERRTNYQEDYNRRSNLRITGIREQPGGETWEEAAKTVSKLLEEKLQLPSMKLERAHRTGPANSSRPRTVVVRFERFGDREAVMRNARKLRGTGIFINEDLCPASQEIRRNQLPLMKKAREEGKTCFFRHTRLIIKDKFNQRMGVTGHQVSTGGSGGAAASNSGVLDPDDAVTAAVSPAAGGGAASTPGDGKGGVVVGVKAQGGAAGDVGVGEGAVQRQRGTRARKK